PGPGHGRAGAGPGAGARAEPTTGAPGQTPAAKASRLLLAGHAVQPAPQLDSVSRKQKRFQAADEEKRKEISFTAEEETLLQILQGKLGLRVHVHKLDDISALLRLVEEFDLWVSVEHALAVDKPHIFQELKEHGIPVSYGPLDAFAYKVELQHENWRNVRHLLDSGVEFGLMSDHPVTLARQLLLQTRWFLRHGYSKQQALEIITRQNAAILGLEQELGTLEQGKWASFVCWNGDPFDLASYPVAVYGEGQLLYSLEG
ncbi:MAG: amidohydrolase family protein, partial [Desulfohalobiaceae bacterium]